MTTLPRRQLTLPQRRLAELGLSPRDVVRAMNRGRRFGARQIDNRAKVVARVLREGNCGELYAQKLGRVLDLNANLLELPRQCWPAAWRGELKAVETPEILSSASDGKGRNPSRRAEISRMQILRLVPTMGTPVSSAPVANEVGP